MNYPHAMNFTCKQICNLQVNKFGECTNRELLITHLIAHKIFAFAFAFAFACTQLLCSVQLQIYYYLLLFLNDERVL